jgi:hypothetical protein
MIESVFDLNENLDFLFTTNIEVISVSAKEKLMNNKSYYWYNDDYYKVEDFAKKVFNNNDYEVYKGVEISGIFNFIIHINQYENQLIRNSKLNNEIYKTDVILHKIKTIIKLKQDLIQDKIFHVKLIDYSEVLFDLFYNYSDEKIINNNYLFNVLRALDQKDLTKLFVFFEQISGLKRGVPDLFILKNKSFYFVEVKSKNDSLSRYQIFFINKFKKIVSDNIFVFHVQINDWN